MTVDTERGYSAPRIIDRYSLISPLEIRLKSASAASRVRGDSDVGDDPAWYLKFGTAYAAGLPRRKTQPSDKWHLDKVQPKLERKRHWPWPAVDKCSNGVYPPT